MTEGKKKNDKSFFIGFKEIFNKIKKFMHNNNTISTIIIIICIAYIISSLIQMFKINVNLSF